MIIRDAVGEDAAQLSALIGRSIVALCLDDHHNDSATLAGWLSNKTPANVAFWISALGCRVFVAQREDKIVGVAGFTHGGDLTLLYVAPEARFTGVSARLLAHVEAQAGAIGMPGLRLTTTFTARRFFLERGYTVMDEEGDIFASADGCELWRALEPPKAPSVAR